MSGRGLLLVARVTAGWGSEPMGHGKVVWFEVRADHVPPATGYTAGDLLARWDFDDEPALRGADYVAARDVLLTGLPTAALVEVKARTDDLGREMALIVSQPEGRPPRLLQVARRLDHLMHALVQLRSAIRAQALAAAVRGDPTLDLQLRVAVDDAERIEAYAEELDAADELARAGGPAVIATAPAARTGRS